MCTFMYVPCVCLHTDAYINKQPFLFETGGASKGINTALCDSCDTSALDPSFPSAPDDPFPVYARACHKCTPCFLAMCTTYIQRYSNYYQIQMGSDNKTPSAARVLHFCNNTEETQK